MASNDVGTINCGKSVFEWEIDNVSVNCKNEKNLLYSPIFYAGNAKWKLQLYPNGNKKENEDFISLYLTLEDATEEGVTVEEYSLSIVDKDNKDIVCYTIPKHKFTSNDDDWGFARFLERKKLLQSQSSMDTNLRILCKISHVIVKEHCTEKENFNSFEKFLNSEKFSDVQFVIGDKILFAHKTILSNKSDVFTAMFEHDMTESISNVIEIEDIDHDVLLEFLKFIYTGKFNKNEKMVMELAIVSDKYAVIELQTICEKYLCETISINNAVEFLNLSDTHNIIKLKKQAIEFITNNAKAIVQDTSQYKSMEDLYSPIVVELFKSLAMKKE